MIYKKLFSLFLFTFGICLASCAPDTRNYSDFENYKMATLSSLYEQKEDEYLVYFYFEECPHCDKIKSDVFDFLSKDNRTAAYMFDIKKKSSIEGTANRDSFKIKPESYTDEDRANMIEEMIGTANSLETTYFFGTPSAYLIKNKTLADYKFGSDDVVKLLKTL